jgi:hypothetical protein
MGTASTRMPLLTSLPPSLSRTSRGILCGERYQEQCAQSWHDAGFAPYSVNSRAELQYNAGLYDLAEKLGVTILPVDCDASSVTGKPHVYLSDMLSTLAGKGVKTFAITNADIFLSPVIGGVVKNMRDNEFVIERRLDVVSISSKGDEYRYGIDFCAANLNVALNLPDIGLIFGVPWWDHYFPLMLGFSGQRRAPMVGGLLQHLKHEERWQQKLWHALGSEFLEKFRVEFVSPKAISKHWTKRIVFELNHRRAEPALLSVSHANVHTLTEWHWQDGSESFVDRLKRYLLVLKKRRL